MKENKLKGLDIDKEVYEIALENSKKSIKAIIKNNLREWGEVRSFMEELKYELWKEFN